MSDSGRWPPVAWFVVLVAAMGLSQELAKSTCPAQSTRVATPLNGVSDSFYEQIGVSWGGRFGGRNGGGFFNFGGPNPGLPPLGGNDPNANARFGFGLNGGGGGFWLGGVAGQGSNRTLSSRTPMVMVPNGGMGSLVHGLQRPFVTGLVPVVGQRNLSPLLERLERLKQEGGISGSDRGSNGQDVSEHEARRGADQERGGGGAAEWTGIAGGESEGRTAQASTAAQGDLSVAEIRRQRDAEARQETAAQQRELAVLLQRAESCEADGKLGAARIYYKQAARLASGTLSEQLRMRAEQLAR